MKQGKNGGIEMKYKKLDSIFKIINMKNINQGITVFNKTVQDFGDSMDGISRELSSDIEKSNKESVAREQKIGKERR